MAEGVSELWKRVSPYLDHALELDPSELAQWLVTLDNSEPQVAAEVRELLAVHSANCASGFLEGRLFDPEEDLMGQRIGPYNIEQLLGRGGMGSVWRGQRCDGKFEGQAAIKLLEHCGLGPDAVDRVRHEASLLARLSHPHIARLFDAGVRENGQPYLILEYIEGIDIDRYCRERKLPLSQRLHLFCDVLDAVAHAHAQLIVHRDIKPSNVLVTTDGLVKLLDFGVASIQPDELQRLQSALLLFDPQGLTPAYAAPEQIRGEPPSTAADVYSLGMLLHVLVTGTHPRAAPGPGATQRTYTTLVVPPSQRIGDAAERRRVRGDLDTIIAHALEDDPGRRYSSAAAFAADVRAYLGNRPVRARPATRLYVAQRFVQRHRTAVFAAVLAVVMLAGASVVTALQLLEARREHAFALAQLGRAEAIDDFNFYMINDSAPAGQKVTLPDLMERAEHVLERERLVDANRVSLLTLVGWEYEAQGYHDKGLKILTEAYRLSRQVADPAARAEAACRFAIALASESATPRSSQLIEEGLRELPRSPEYALDRSKCLTRATNVAWQLGESQLALQRIQEAIQVLKEVPFPHQAADLSVRRELANALSEAGRHSEALAAYADSWNRTVALGRDATPSASILLNNWAVALAEARRPLEGAAVLRRAMDLAAGSPPEPAQLANYAGMLTEIGRPQEAAGYAERAVRAAEAVNSPRGLALCKIRWATAYRMQHDFSRAGELLDEAEPLLRKTVPPGDRSLGLIIGERALLAQARGEPHEALALMNQVMQLFGQAAQHGQSGGQHIPGVLASRALIEIDAAAYPDAEADARQAIKLLDAPPNDYTSAGGRAYLALARALSVQGKTAEARQQAQEAVRQLEKALGPDAPETRQARQLLAAAQ